jgi:DNA-binding transcriptional MocR family regulator
VARFGPAVSADQVLMVPGAQPALLTTIAAMLRPGDRLMTEEMTYPGVRSVLALLGVIPEVLPVDEYGLVPKAFDAACRTSGSRAVYCVPNFQNPTGVVMPEARRREIAAIARKHGTTIIEDDVYGFLAEPSLPSLASLLPQQTCYLTSASKSVSPALRLGFLIAPPALIHRLESSLSAAVAFTSTVAGEVFALLMESGEIERITRRKKLLVEQHQKLARRIFGDRLGRTDAASPHSWLTLPKQIDAQTVANEAAARGVAIAPACTFSFDRRRTPNALRISIGATISTAALEQALVTVAGVASGDYIPCASVM